MPLSVLSSAGIRCRRRRRRLDDAVMLLLLHLHLLLLLGRLCGGGGSDDEDDCCCCACFLCCSSAVRARMRSKSDPDTPGKPFSALSVEARSNVFDPPLSRDDDDGLPPPFSSSRQHRAVFLSWL